MARNLVPNHKLENFLVQRSLDESDLNKMVQTLIDTGGLNVFGEIHFPGAQLFVEQTDDDRFVVDGENVYNTPRNATLAAIRPFHTVLSWSD